MTFSYSLLWCRTIPYRLLDMLVMYYTINAIKCQGKSHPNYGKELRGLVLSRHPLSYIRVGYVLEHPNMKGRAEWMRRFAKSSGSLFSFPLIDESLK
jgi:hypothetical protein